MAVDPSSGCRVGPPGITEELEYGLLREMTATTGQTPVVTMADSSALVKGMALGESSLCSKVPADIICTPTGTRKVRKSPKLAGLDWEKIGRRRMSAMRLLRRLRELPATTPSPKAPAASRSGKGGRTAA